MLLRHANRLAAANHTPTTLVAPAEILPLRQTRDQAAKVEEEALRCLKELEAMSGQPEHRPLRLSAGFAQVFADEVQRLAERTSRWDRIGRYVVAIRRSLQEVAPGLESLQGRLGEVRTESLRRAFDDLGGELDKLAQSVK